jgi:hypothetical protein
VKLRFERGSSNHPASRISPLKAAARFLSKRELFFSCGYRIRLKSPTISHGPTTVSERASISATNSAVREWSEGAYTFVREKARSAEHEAKEVVRLKFFWVAAEQERTFSSQSDKS